MNKVKLTEEQLSLLNGNTNDVEELSLADLFAIAGGTATTSSYGYGHYGH